MAKEEGLVEKFEHAGRTVKIFLDPEPMNPRTEWDNTTTMVHWHRRYELGDKRVEPMNANDLKVLCADDPILAIKPLYLYDHSGLTVSTGSFSCPWDSGQVGWVYVTKSKAEEAGLEDTSTEALEKIIDNEVKTYDEYLTGQVFGYVIEGRDGEHLESCWGFFGGSDYCIEEAKRMAECTDDPAVEREVEALQSRATFAMNTEEA